MFSSIDEGSISGDQGESARVLDRTGDTIIAEFLTKSGRRKYRTLEEIHLYPPERITFRHLEGPLNFVEEEFKLTEKDMGTELQYKGEIEYKVPFLPGLGWLIARYYVSPKYNAVICDHTEKLKAAAETHAAGSHNQEH